MSFKHGDAERTEGERFFNDLDETTLKSILNVQPELEVVRVWITEDLRNYARGPQQVLNAIVRRNRSAGFRL
jgi:hypothetical protein